MLDGFMGKSGGFWQDAAENYYAKGGGGANASNSMGRGSMATSAHMQKGLDAEHGRDPMQMLSGLLSMSNASNQNRQPSGRLQVYDLMGLLGGQVPFGRM